MKINLWLTLLLFQIHVPAVAQPTTISANLEGSWEGPLVISRDEMVLTISIVIQQDELQATLTSNGLGVFGLPADPFSLDGFNIKATFPRLNAEISGRIRLNDNDQIVRIDANWFQDAEMVPIALLPVVSPRL